jgi:hypothetical protein
MNPMPKQKDRAGLRAGFPERSCAGRGIEILIESSLPLTPVKANSVALI